MKESIYVRIYGNLSFLRILASFLAASWSFWGSPTNLIFFNTNNFEVAVFLLHKYTVPCAPWWCPNTYKLIFILKHSIMKKQSKTRTSFSFSFLCENHKIYLTNCLLNNIPVHSPRVSSNVTQCKSLLFEVPCIITIRPLLCSPPLVSMAFWWGSSESYFLQSLYYLL